MTRFIAIAKKATSTIRMPPSQTLKNRVSGSITNRLAKLTQCMRKKLSQTTNIAFAPSIITLSNRPECERAWKSCESRITCSK